MAIEFITILDATGTQRKVAVDLFNTDEYAQVEKIAWGSDGVVTLVETAAPLPISAIQMPAAADTTDAISAATQVGKLKSGLVDVTPIRAFSLVAQSSSHLTLKSAVAGKSLVVVAFIVVCGATPSTVVFESSTSNTAISPVYTFGANGGINPGFNEAGWMATAVGDALNVTTGAGSSTAITAICAAV